MKWFDDIPPHDKAPVIYFAITLAVAAVIAVCVCAIKIVGIVHGVPQ